MLADDLAIDLGTANTLIYMKRRGIVLNESSVVVVRTDATNGKRVLAVGADAKNMVGKTPINVAAIRPMRDGVIADFEAAGAMLGRFIRKVRRGIRLMKPRMVIAVPSGITPVERRAVRESALQAGAKEVFLIEEPMAAAIGANLPVTEPACNMVVDIGGGTTEVAVISLGGIVASRSIKIAGDEMDEAIIRYVKKAYNFIIGERTAEEIKIAIGNADPDSDHPESMEVKGWEVFSGRPKIFSLDAMEVRDAISDQLAAVLETIRLVLDKTPQELAAGVIDHGVVLTGGVALLKNLDAFLERESGLPMKVADDPLSTIVMGSGMALCNPRLFSQVVAARSPRADR
jgi:rod shape-determining protein MreB